jgi:thymidylate synthase (FAD)
MPADTAVAAPESTRRIELHEHGHVVLEDALGSDLHIVNNARVSFDQESDEFGPRERGLLGFLMRERHGSPWESVVFRFDVKAPMFVIREWQRHRVSSFNEQSARYSEIPDHYYVPAREYLRTQQGKPGAYYFETIADDAVATQAADLIADSQRASFGAYHRLLELGVAKEVARVVMPVGTFSRMKWTVNLRSLFNFLSLRNHEHAQREIRDYAQAVEQLARAVCPSAFEAFDEHGRTAP